MQLNLADIPQAAHYDVVIIGGGMVGASTALGLFALPIKVLVIEAFPVVQGQPELSPSYDARSTALSAGSAGILSDLGVWERIAKNISVIQSVHVSEQGRFGSTQLDAAKLGLDALGYVVQNQWLGQCLMNALQALANVDILSTSKIKAMQPKPDGYTLEIQSVNDHQTTKQISAQLVIIADGANSESCRLVGIETETTSYAQYALVANVSTEQHHNGVAYERFTPKGPLALLPLGERTSALVWTLSNEEFQEVEALAEPAIRARLQQRFGDRLGQITKMGKYSSYALNLSRAKEQIRPGLVVLGNAAHALHPVAGQGFNLALRGVACLVETLSLAKSDGQPIGALRVLKGFLEQQSADQSKTILFSDQLIKIFGSQFGPLSLLRDAGLLGLDILPGAKGLFAKHAMGMGGRQAILVKPVSNIEGGS